VALPNSAAISMGIRYLNCRGADNRVANRPLSGENNGKSPAHIRQTHPAPRCGMTEPVSIPELK
jgi:hypothetical protein